MLTRPPALSIALNRYYPLPRLPTDPARPVSLSLQGRESLGPSKSLAPRPRRISSLASHGVRHGLSSYAPPGLNSTTLTPSSSPSWFLPAVPPPVFNTAASVRNGAWRRRRRLRLRCR